MGVKGASANYWLTVGAIFEKERMPPGYKLTDVGMVPEEWTVMSLGELFSFAGGLSASRDELGMNGYHYLHYGDIHTSSKSLIEVGEAWIPRLEVKLSRVPKRSLLCDGDVVFVDASEDEEGASKHVVVKNSTSVPFIAGLHTIIAKPKGKDLDIAFRRYGFQGRTTKDQFRFYAAGTKVLGVSKSHIKKIQVPVPPLAEQAAIAKLLSDADALIESLQQLIAKKRALKQGAMQALLTGNIRLRGFDSEWQLVRLGDIASFYKGNGLPKSAITPYGTAPCVHYGELFTRLPETILDVISRTDPAEGCFLSEVNDVLMPTSDVTPTGLAKASCLQIKGVVIGGDVLVIRSPQSILSGSFLSYVIRNSEKQVLELVTGTTVFHLYASDMAKFEFKLPDLVEQTAIVAVLSDMNAEIDALETRLAKTRDLKAGMMQALLTGRIRLPQNCVSRPRPKAARPHAKADSG